MALRLSLYRIGTEDFCESARIVMEECFDHVVKIGRTKLDKHLKFWLLNFFEYILFIVRFMELRIGAATCRSPCFNPKNRRNEVWMSATVEPAKCLKSFRVEYFNLKFDYWNLKLLTKTLTSFLLLLVYQFWWWLHFKTGTCVNG